MRTTVDLDDDLLRELKERAAAEKLSLTRYINRLLRRALETPGAAQPRRAFRQDTFSLGDPAIDLCKGLSLATDLEDAQTIASRVTAARGGSG